jgi:hypothetical protein
VIAYCLDVDSNVMDYLENLNATYSNCTLVQFGNGGSRIKGITAFLYTILLNDC